MSVDTITQAGYVPEQPPEPVEYHDLTQSELAIVAARAVGRHREAMLEAAQLETGDSAAAAATTSGVIDKIGDLRDRALDLVSLGAILYDAKMYQDRISRRSTAGRDNWSDEDGPPTGGFVPTGTIGMASEMFYAQIVDDEHKRMLGILQNRVTLTPQESELALKGIGAAIREARVHGDDPLLTVLGHAVQWVMRHTSIDGATVR